MTPSSNLRLTRLTLGGVVSLALLAAVALAGPGRADSSGAGTASSAGGGSFVKAWVAENESPTHNFSEAQAVSTARQFDQIVALPGTYDSYVRAMKSANPNLKILSYMNGMFASSGQGSAYPESWYMRDAGGNKIRSTGYGNYLMRFSEPGWVSSRTQECRARLAQSGYDGCMLDMLGTAPLFPGYTTTLPRNPATGRTYTEAEWTRGTSALASQVRNGVEPKLVWGNGYGSATRYFAPDGPTSQLSSGVDGALTESWIRTSKQGMTSYKPEDQWKQAVDQLVDLGRRGKVSSVMVKLWANGTQAQKDAYHKYALATFMLGSDGRSLFNLSYDRYDQHTVAHRWWSVPVGSPSGSYAKVGQAYSRTFSNGRVLVNPGSGSVTVPLGRTYRDLNGNSRSSVTLGAHSAEILVG